MSEISAIGLGLMGAALVQALHGAGHGLTVWNRTPEKMRPFIDAGVDAAGSAAEAVDSSPVILLCIDNYAISNELLSSPEIASRLPGKTVIQLSTGTPREAQETADWMREQGVSYLDGAILAGPNDIGSDNSTILVCGDEDIHAACANLLARLGRVRYLGPNIRAASALDLAWLCAAYGRFMAVAQAALICDSESVGMDEFAHLFAENSLTRRNAGVVHEQSFADCTATLKVWRAALMRIQQQGRDAGINTDFPDHVADILQRAESAGHGEQHVMAMIKVMSASAT